MAEHKSEKAFLPARAADAIRLCEADGLPKFVGFLDEAQAAEIRAFCAKRAGNFRLFGGYEGAERVMLGVFPDWMEAADAAYPIEEMTLAFRKGAGLTHRDFLGSLMALRLKREAVGDILIEDGRAVCFLTAETAPLVLQELRKIGGTGVTVALGAERPLPRAHEFLALSATLPSPRLDAAVAALAKTGRGEAVSLVESGLVTVDALVCEKPTRRVDAGNVIAVRGKGKFILDSLDGQTKKGRLVLQYRKYQ